MVDDATDVSSAWRVRPAGLEDIATILQLVHAAYRGESSRAGWTTEADLLDGSRTDGNELHDFITTPDSVVLLAVHGAGCLGTVHVRHAEGIVHLGLLAVRPDQQGHGIGRQLLAAAESYARERWPVQAMRMTVIRQRTELIAYYERRGYRRTGERQAFPTHPRYGIPKITGIELAVLEKRLAR